MDTCLNTFTLNAGKTEYVNKYFHECFENVNCDIKFYIKM